MDRTVRYVGEVCIIDPLTNASVPNTQITIQRQNIFFTRDGQSREGEVTGIPEMNAGQQSEVESFRDGKQIYLEGQSRMIMWFQTLVVVFSGWIKFIINGIIGSTILLEK